MPDSIVCSPFPKMRFAPRHPLLVAIFLAVGFAAPLQAYAPLGHEIVGAIADERLANTPTAAKIRALLNGMTLEKAAVIPDEIKGWDKRGVDDPKSFHYTVDRKIDMQGKVADPDKDRASLPDEGGNTFTLELSDDLPRSRGIHRKTFHGFWDYDAVNTLFPEVPKALRKNELQSQIEPLKKQLVHEMAAHEPRNWQMPANLEIRKYAEAWADEILPVAREAHQRLQFTNGHPLPEEDRVLAAGEAEEKPMPDHIAYRTWATNVVGKELHKAGWRLADLLEKALR